MLVRASRVSFFLFSLACQDVRACVCIADSNIGHLFHGQYRQGQNTAVVSVMPASACSVDVATATESRRLLY